MVIDITEYFSQLGIKTISDLFANPEIKEGLSKATEDNNISALVYFSSILHSKLIDLDRKQFLKKINFDLISQLFCTEKSYLPLQKIAILLAKNVELKKQFLELLRKYLLVDSDKVGTTARSGQADFITNCLLLCIAKGSSRTMFGPAEYFTDEIIFNRIVDCATDTTHHEVGTIEKQIQFQMLDSARYILQILYFNPAAPITLQILSTVHNYVPSMQHLLHQSQTTGSLTSSLKSLQLFEELMRLYSVVDVTQASYHNEAQFILQVYSVVCHSRQYVLLPQCSSILKQIFSFNSPKPLLKICHQSLIQVEKKWRPHLQNPSIRFFFLDLWNLLDSLELLTPEDKQKFEFLQITEIPESPIESTPTPNPKSTCNIL